MHDLYPELEDGRDDLCNYEHPMTAVGIVLMSAALLQTTSPRALMSFTGYSFQFVSAIVLNLLNNRLWANGRYDPSAWLPQGGTIETEALWEHIEIACGNYLSLQADSDVCANPCGLFWDERGDSMLLTDRSACEPATQHKGRMPMRTILVRVERAERVAKAQSTFSADCLCFPTNEPPQLAFDIEFELAAAVKCPLHGERFKPPQLRVYMAKWFRENRYKLLWSHHSEQYRKAWFASFPQTLWPAQEIEDEEGATLLILRDGTKLFAMAPIGGKKEESICYKTNINGGPWTSDLTVTKMPASCAEWKRY